MTPGRTGKFSSSGVFADNLLLLIRGRGSKSGIARDLGIHRTQLSRYLSGKSQPRAHQLQKICKYFDVTANITVEPLNSEPAGHGYDFSDPTLNALVERTASVDTDYFPAGFYTYWRYSSVHPGRVVVSLEHFFIKDGSMRMQGIVPLSGSYAFAYGTVTMQQRRYFASVMQVKDGIVILENIGVIDTMAFTFIKQGYRTYDNIYHGCAYLARYGDAGGVYLSPAVYQRIPQDFVSVLKARRNSGHVAKDKMPKLIREILAAPITTAVDRTVASRT